MDIGAESSLVDRVHNQVVHVEPHLDFFVAGQFTGGVDVVESALERWIKAEGREAFKGLLERDCSIRVSFTGGMLEGGPDLQGGVIDEKASQAVVGGIVHVGSGLNMECRQSSVHFEILSDKTVIFIDETALSVQI